MRGRIVRDPEGGVERREERRAGALIALVAVVLLAGAAIWTRPAGGGERPAPGPVAADPWSDIGEHPVAPSILAVPAVFESASVVVEATAPRAPSDAIMVLHFVGAGRDSCSGTSLPPPV